MSFWFFLPHVYALALAAFGDTWKAHRVRTATYKQYSDLETIETVVGNMLWVQELEDMKISPFIALTASIAIALENQNITMVGAIVVVGLLTSMVLEHWRYSWIDFSPETKYHLHLSRSAWAKSLKMASVLASTLLALASV